MIINFNTTHGRYLDKNALKFVNVANKYLYTLTPVGESLPTEVCVDELKKILPCEVMLKRKEGFPDPFIWEIAFEEKDYVMFLLKYDV